MRLSAPTTAPLRWLPALALASLLPGAALAQVAPPGPRGPAVVRITPFIGWATPVTRKETWSYVDGSGATARDQVRTYLAGGLAGGVALQLRLSGPFSVMGAVTYLDRDDAQFSVNNGDRWIFTGSRNILAKAGFGLELRDPNADMTVRRLSAGAFVAPFYLIEKPKSIAGIQASDLFATAHHVGLNFGATGELPFAHDRLALQLGIEDYLIFWNEAQLQRLPDWLLDAPAGNGTAVEAETTSQWLLRAGITVRIH